MKTIELTPVRESEAEWDVIERRIKSLFKREIYIPVLEAADTGSRLKNAFRNAIKPSLIAALQSGRITYQDGIFSGQFSSATSKALRELGASWNDRDGTFTLTARELPMELRPIISASVGAFDAKLQRIDAQLARISPAEIADRLKVSDLFDRAIWKTDSAIKQSLKAITVHHELDPGQRRRLADEWQRNLKLHIKDFTEKEIFSLRDLIAKRAMRGNRYGGVVKAIEESYGVSASKAQFLARQETRLMMAKLKKERYTDAGSQEYKWRCVVGTPKHPVRPSHKILDGKVFRWDDPPITTAPSEAARRNNPGEDYNCRCSAIPIIRLKE